VLCELGLGVIRASSVQMGQRLRENGLWLAVRFSILGPGLRVCEQAILRTASPTVAACATYAARREVVLAVQVLLSVSDWL
jgi:hypothetical protein